MNANIKLALSGQIYDLSSMLLDTVGCERTDACWQSLPVDAGSITYLLKEITESSDGYLFWHNVQHGLYVAYTKRSARRNGFAMVTLCLGHKRIVDAAEFCEGLTYLLQGYTSAGRLADVDKMHLKTIMDELAGHLVDAPSTKIFSADTEAQLAYTTYSDRQKLYDILSCPQQDVYASYGKLYIINQDNAKPAASGFYPLVLNIKKEYRLVLDSTSEYGKVEAKSLVRAGEKFTINYIPNGCAPVSKEQIAGVNSDYSYLDEANNKIIIKGYDKIKDSIKKVRRITFKIHPANSGREIKDFQLYIDGKSILLTGLIPTINFEEKEYTIDVVARGYNKHKFKFDARSVQNGGIYDIPLEPATVDVPLTIRYDKNEYSGNVSLSYNNDLYKPLSELSGETLVSSRKSGSSKGGWKLWTCIVIMLIGIGVGGYFIGRNAGESAANEKYAEYEKKWASHDETYLKNNTTWKLCDLQSPSYAEKLEKLLKGDESAIDKKNNSTYEEVLMLLDSLHQFDAAMSKDLLTANNEEINLAKLKEQIPATITDILTKMDSTYLVDNNIWKKADIKSEKYINFMIGIEKGNAIGLSKHTELNANAIWSEIQKKLATQAAGLGNIVKKYYSESGEVDLIALKDALYPQPKQNTSAGNGSHEESNTSNTPKPGKNKIR